ncbi:unnamed protein product [Camellia sinensis]
MANLPIIQFEEKIVETVEQNPVVVIIGETGSGKSTQLSQILHRKGYTRSGIIAVTQPRRVAAVSVSRELGVRLGEEVGYAIRFEDRTSEKTCIKYLIDGVLLRESLSNPELNQYSVIILDEAHERSLNTDILLGLMKRLIRMRASNLKVLITSATLDGEKVSKIFLQLPYTQCPWEVIPRGNILQHGAPKEVDLFRRWRNFEDGLRRIRKRDFEILSIARNHLDEKGLAGRVVEWFDVVLMYEDCQKHADWYCQKGFEGTISVENTNDIGDDFTVDSGGVHLGNLWLSQKPTKVKFKGKDPNGQEMDSYVTLFTLHNNGNYGYEIHWKGDDVYIHVREPEGDVLIFMTGQDDIEKLVKKLEERVQSLEEGSCMDAVILPLHGSLPPELQVRVFSPPPPNCRRFIVATNIAETSLTVDGVVYVIDSGYVKQRQYNPSTGMYSLDVVQISRVQADQRAGRAGRTLPGKCYRLYPSMVYHEELLDATVPEIQRSSLAGTVLYLKSLDLPDMDILKFDFLDSPSSESLEDALKQLYLIDAIDENGSISSIGRTMAELPLEPSLSRTLMEANEYGCLSQALTVAAMLSAETTLLPGRSKSTEKKRKHDSSDLPNGSGWGDHIQLLQIYELWGQTDYDVDWCKDNNLQVRGMKFVRDVRKQLSQIMQKLAKGSLDVRTNERRKESQEDYRNLRKSLSVGYANQLAERMIRHNGYRTLGFKPQLVQVHPSSVLRTDEEGMLPNYVVYHELISTSHPFMRNVCAVEMPWVMPILKKLEKLNISKLSGGSGQSEEQTEGDKSSLPKKDEVDVARPVDDRDSQIQAARERFLARKGKR